MALNDLIVRLHLVGENRSAVEAMLETGEVSKRVSKDMESNFDKSTNRIGGLFTRLGQHAESMGTPFGKVLSEVGTKFEEAEKKGHGFLGMISGLGAAATGAGLAAFVGIAGESVKIALDGAQAQSNLEVAVKNSGQSFEEAKGKIDASYNSMAKLGFNADQTNVALTTLITATGSTAKATALMGQVADLARLKHMSLADAASAVAKIMGGSTRIVKQLGLNLNVQSGSATSVAKAHQAVIAAEIKLARTQYEVNNHILKGTKAQWALQDAQTAVKNAQDKYNSSAHATTTILDAIQQKTKGAATGFSDTLPGKMQAFNAQITNMGKQLGEWLIPKLTVAAGWVSNFVGFLTRNKGAVADFGMAVAGIGTALSAIWAFNKVKGIFSAMKDAGGALKSIGKIGGGGTGSLGGEGGLIEALATNTAATEANTVALGGEAAGGGAVGTAAKGGVISKAKGLAGAASDAAASGTVGGEALVGAGALIGTVAGTYVVGKILQAAAPHGPISTARHPVGMSNFINGPGYHPFLLSAGPDKGQSVAFTNSQFSAFAKTYQGLAKSGDKFSATQIDALAEALAKAWDKSGKPSKNTAPVTLNVASNASPQQIAAAVARALRTAGAR
jgi:hypothetical protein